MVRILNAAIVGVRLHWDMLLPGVHLIRYACWWRREQTLTQLKEQGRGFTQLPLIPLFQITLKLIGLRLGITFGSTEPSDTVNWFSDGWLNSLLANEAHACKR